MDESPQSFVLFVFSLIAFFLCKLVLPTFLLYFWLVFPEGYF